MTMTNTAIAPDKNVVGLRPNHDIMVILYAKLLGFVKKKLVTVLSFFIYTNFSIKSNINV